MQAHRMLVVAVWIGVFHWELVDRQSRGVTGGVCGLTGGLSNAQDMESFARGRELFRGGLLTEAVLALEAEVQRQPGNVPAWLLLGTIHAENDDDLQVGAR